MPTLDIRITRILSIHVVTVQLPSEQPRQQTSLFYDKQTSNEQLFTGTSLYSVVLFPEALSIT